MRGLRDTLNTMKFYKPGRCETFNSINRKVTITNSVAFPILVCAASILPYDVRHVYEAQRETFKYLWKNKPDLIKTNTIIMEKDGDD